MIRALTDAVTTGRRRILAWALLLPLVFQVVMLIALMVRFQDIPNYVVFYDWIGAVWVIIQSTPAWSDIPPIVWEEWLIEIGYMNRDYGMGISEWSLNVVPSRLLVMAGLGAMVGLAAELMRADQCSPATLRSSGLATGVGALLVTMTNATMSWVVCCATPSWVVGLAMLGLGVSTSLAMESMGPAITGTGFAMMSLMILFLAWRKSRAPAAEPAHA